MTLAEMKRKYLSLIEELNPGSDHLTDDPDIQVKQNDVINQIMFELARFKKIPKYVEIEVKAGETVDFAKLERECGYEIYQIERICGPVYIEKAGGTVLKFLENGTVEIDVNVYPERITDKTKPNAYEFILSNDALEIMPYGIAGDILKNDVSTGYGQVYSARYKEMIQMLDHRYQTGIYSMEGGITL